MNLLEYFARHHREILQATLEHVWLVGIAMLLAVAVGVPLGVLVAAIETDFGRSEYRGDHSEPGAFWIFTAGAVVGRPC